MTLSKIHYSANVYARTADAKLQYVVALQKLQYVWDC